MAKRYTEHRALNMFSLVLKKWEFPLHTHNFFELIFITEGKGQHLINGFNIPYKQHSCFLITPEDEHEFIIEDTTRFEYLKFTELLLQERNNIKWQQKILTTLKKINLSGKEIICDENDRGVVRELLKMMRDEYEQNKLLNREILLDLFGALLSVLMRNLVVGQSEKKLDLSGANEKIQAMLAYLRENLTQKEKTNIEHLANRFQISPAYVSEFFKKHTNETLQQFTIRSKLKIAERYLKQSNFTISQIADKLEFNDASHFSKIFIRSYGQSPGAFRKAAK